MLITVFIVGKQITEARHAGMAKPFYVFHVVTKGTNHV